jgi:hypothetical protein
MVKGQSGMVSPITTTSAHSSLDHDKLEFAVAASCLLRTIGLK